jgi:hypothetical protein
MVTLVSIHSLKPIGKGYMLCNVITENPLSTGVSARPTPAIRASGCGPTPFAKGVKRLLCGGSREDNEPLELRRDVEAPASLETTRPSNVLTLSIELSHVKFTVLRACWSNFGRKRCLHPQRLLNSKMSV